MYTSGQCKNYMTDTNTRQIFVETLTELARKDPKIILIVGDVGFSYIEDFAKEFPKKKALLVFGASDGKNVMAMAEMLAFVSAKVFVTGAKYRAMPLQRLASCFDGLGLEVEIVAGVENAVKKAISCAKPNDVVLVAGSCFVVGEAFEFFKKKK